MARSRRPADQKLRTREHVIADLAVNAVERQVLFTGYTLDLIHHDYGYDATITTYTAAGEPKPGWIYTQIKGTDHPRRSPADGSLAFRIQRSHLVLWLRELLPVLLCVYDTQADVVYYQEIQAYFESIPDFNIFEMGETVTVRLPSENRFVVGAIRQLNDRLEQRQNRIREALNHD